MAVGSVRPLVSGTGTVSVTAGSRLMYFTSPQNFKEGASVVVDAGGTPQYFTIDQGVHTPWTAIQPATGTVSGASFLRSNESTSMPGARARGGANTYIIPNALHYAYRAMLDSSGVSDMYTYVDTLAPENGMHPYTRDPFVGLAGSAAKTQAIVPDMATRLRRAEGCLRAHGTPGTLFEPDKRLLAMEARVRLLELEAGGPAAQPATGWSLEQLTSYGDPV